jgi:hypothetical protein
MAATVSSGPERTVEDQYYDSAGLPAVHADLSGHRRLHRGYPLPADLFGVLHQSRPQRPDPRRAGGRHPAVLRAGVRLFREIRWVNSFRAGFRIDGAGAAGADEGAAGRSSTMALSTNTMRSILDSIATRLDESRDISRYLIGLLVFLGLLGTFWGLLGTIGSISTTIQSLDPGSGDANDVLNR